LDSPVAGGVASGVAAMWQQFHSVRNTFWSWVFSLSQGEWLVLLIGVMVVGFLCLRGFGSRAGY